VRALCAAYEDAISITYAVHSGDGNAALRVLSWRADHYDTYQLNPQTVSPWLLAAGADANSAVQSLKREWKHMLVSMTHVYLPALVSL
jgi:hypothetical protein